MSPEHPQSNAASNTASGRLATRRTHQTRDVDKAATAAPAAVDLTSTCPECETDDAIATVDGETVCEACGAIYDTAESIDHGPEWRAHTQQEYNDRCRVGPARDPSDPDYGHQTFMGGRTEFRKLNMSGRREQAFARMKQLRHRDDRGDSRNTSYGLEEITRMLTSLGYHESAAQQAATLFRKGQAENLSHSRGIEAHAAAVVYATLRIHRHPVTLADVTNVARADRASIANAYDALKATHDIPIPVQHPADYVARIASSVDAPRELEQAVTALLDAIHDKPVAQGKHPAGFAAAAFDALVALTPPDHYYTDTDPPSSAELARSVEVAPGTVRQNTDRLEEHICGTPDRSQAVQATIDAPIVCPRPTA